MSTVELRGTSRAPIQRLVRHHLVSFLDRVTEAGGHLPFHVHRAMTRMAACGDPIHGFAWLRCPSCEHDRLVPFVCRTRGLCPSCGGRRMVELSTHWVNRVLPRVPVRQWVVSVPWGMRLLLARRHDLCRMVLGTFLRAVFAYYRAKAKRQHGVCGGRTGAVTVVQRFGSALNLNVHFHCLLLDGVYVEEEGWEGPRFYRVSPPSTEELESLLLTAVTRIERGLERRGFGPEEEQDEDDGDALSLLSAASIAGRIALGRRAGHRVRRVRRLGGRDVPLPPHCAQVGGFNLHAGVRIGARNRQGLERLCRYIARPPLPASRLETRADGSVLLQLKRAWSDGTRQLVFSPLELVEKLAALVPPPRVNQTFYHGVLGARSAWRSAIVPKTVEVSQLNPLRKQVAVPRPRWRIRWAELLWRTFEVDGWQCPNCGETLELRAVVIHPPATTRVLDGLLARGPPTEKNRAS